MKFGKITVKSRNGVKCACFRHVLCHISAIFEDIDSKFCTHIYQHLTSNKLYVFFEIFDFEGEIFEKEKKMLTILDIFEYLNFLKSKISVL